MIKHFASSSFFLAPIATQNDIDKALQRLNSPGSNVAFLTTSDRLKYLLSSENPFQTLEQRLMSGFLCLAFPKNHFLFEGFNKKIEQLTTGGVMQKLIEHKKPSFVADGGPSVLTLSHLGIGFCIWAIAALIAFAAFCLEHLKHWIETKLYKFAIAYIKKAYKGF